jgi:23S rRNA (adenine2503-C2)-methyltransferase
MKKRNLVGLIKPEGFDYSHALAITNSIYKKRTAAISLITKIPGGLKKFLAGITFVGIYEPAVSEVSIDKTTKYLFRNAEGKQFETVYIPDGKRNTVCVSTQSGCRMGCPFCVTAKYGFHGNLDAGDIINQVISIPHSGKVTHVVLMGMGEPLDNLGNVLKACEVMTSEWGMAISPRNITVSTVGIKPSIEPFLGSSGCNLALSLFSPFPSERINIVPAERIFPALEIIEIMRNFPVKKKRRLSIAYVMIKNVNDTERHLEELKKILNGTGIRVNLLPYHKVKDDENISSSDERMLYFKHNLVVSGVSASIRKSRGADISAACGLLASGLRPGSNAK